MNKFTKTETNIDGVFIIEPTVFGDERGFFLESYTKRDFVELGIECEFVQDNHSKSKKGVLRGLHFQTKYAQAKLVRVVAGSVLDVAVDIRKESNSFGKWFAVEISEKNKKQLFIPAGCAHGFLTLQDNTEFLYKCSDYYEPQYDCGILWNDSELAVDWQLEKYGLSVQTLTLSEKDKKQQTFAEYRTKLFS